MRNKGIKLLFGFLALLLLVLPAAFADLFEDTVLINHFDDVCNYNNGSIDQTDGTIGNSPEQTTTVFQVGTGSCRFDDEDNDYVDYDNSLISGVVNKTISFWTNVTSPVDGQTYVSSDATFSTNGNWEVWSGTSGHLYYDTYIDGARRILDTGSGALDETYESNSWELLTIKMIYNNADNNLTAKFYVNTTYVGEESVTVTTFNVPTAGIRVGALERASGTGIDDGLDEMVIWGRVLSDEDLSEHYTAGAAGVNLAADSTAPTINSVVLSDTSLSSGSTIQVNVSFTDDTGVGQVWLADNRTGSFLNISSINFTSETSATAIFNETVQEGTIQFLATAVDESGNSVQNQSEIYNSTEIDPPGFGAASINNSAPRINEVVELSQLTIDASTITSATIFQNQSGNFVNSTAAVNEYNVSYNLTVTLPKGSVVGYGWWVQDEFGNVNTSEISTFTVENTLPTTTITYPLDQILYSTQPLEWNVSVSDPDGDAITTIEWYVNGTLNQTTGQVNTTLNASDDHYNLSARAADDEGFGKLVYSDIILDATQPLLRFMPENETPYTKDTNFTVQAENSNLFGFNCTLYDGPTGGNILFSQEDLNIGTATAQITVPFNASQYSDGKYLVSCAASDDHTDITKKDYVKSKQAIGKGNGDDDKLALNFKSKFRGGTLDIGVTLNQVSIAGKVTKLKGIDFGTIEGPDRTNFYWDLSSLPKGKLKKGDGITATLIYESDMGIYDRSFNHPFPSFVTGDDWVDFNLCDPDTGSAADATYAVRRISNTLVEVDVTTSQTNLTFCSIGGVNQVYENSTLEVDNTLPVFESFTSIPGSGSFTNNDTVNFTHTIGETNNKTIGYYRNGVFIADFGGYINNVSQASGLDITGLSDGNHTFILEAKDTANNTVNSSSILIVYDTTDPSINSQSSGTVYANIEHLNFTYNVTELYTTQALMYVDGVANESQTYSDSQAETISSGVGEDGSFALVVEFSDIAGNKVNSSTYTVVVDTIAPNVTSATNLTLGGSNNILDSIDVNLSVTIEDTNNITSGYITHNASGVVDQFNVTLSGNGTYSTTISSSLLTANVPVTWNYSFSDAAGNTVVDTHVFTPASTPVTTGSGSSGDSGFGRGSGLLSTNCDELGLVLGPDNRCIQKSEVLQAIAQDKFLDLSREKIVIGPADDPIVTIPNLGQVVYPPNPILGWIVLGLFMYLSVGIWRDFPD